MRKYQFLSQTVPYPRLLSCYSAELLLIEKEQQVTSEPFHRQRSFSPLLHKLKCQIPNLFVAVKISSNRRTTERINWSEYLSNHWKLLLLPSFLYPKCTEYLRSSSLIINFKDKIARETNLNLEPLVTAGTSILALILHKPLLAFTRITSKEDDPLLDIHEVTQTYKSIYQQNTTRRYPTDSRTSSSWLLMMFSPS